MFTDYRRSQHCIIELNHVLKKPTGTLVAQNSLKKLSTLKILFLLRQNSSNIITNDFKTEELQETLIQSNEHMTDLLENCRNKAQLRY
jgi:hypothetical protein